MSGLRRVLQRLQQVREQLGRPPWCGLQDDHHLSLSVIKEGDGCLPAQSHGLCPPVDVLAQFRFAIQVWAGKVQDCLLGKAVPVSENRP